MSVNCKLVWPKNFGVTGHLKYVIPRVVIFNWSNFKSDSNERISHKLITFFLDMTESSQPVMSQTQLKRELASLAPYIYNIDLQI